MTSVRILNAELQNLSFAELLECYTSGMLVGLNVDTFMKLQKNAEYAKICSAAEFVVGDGQIVIGASKLLGTPLKEKISGSDFLGAFCQFHRHNPAVRVFLLGAGPGIADKARERINARTESEIVVGAHSPSYGFEKKSNECDEIVNIVNSSGATALVVGVGAPKQEIWISRHRNRMPDVKWFMAMGATIDFEAGTLKRAPRWMSQAGLEWLYRLSQEPRRLSRRYLIECPPFFWLLAKQQLGIYRDPHQTYPSNGGTSA